MDERQEKANKANILLAICNRAPIQDEEADEIFYKQQSKVSQPPGLVLVGYSPDVCWKSNTAERKQPRRFLECVEENFLTQLVNKPTRETNWELTSSSDRKWRHFR